MDGDAEKRPQFGARYLTESADVFKHNAWDDVEWTEEQINEAKAKIEANATEKLSEERRLALEKDASGNWDKFYGIHANRFFKDRNWLFTELPELKDEDRKVVFEVGCGVGNTVFPILQRSLNPDLRVFCCDFSSQAVDLVRENAEFDSKRCVPFVCDATKAEDWTNAPLEDNSVDVALLIFALSAMEPEGMKTAVKNIARVLKPGGIVFFRDYGQFDMAQLRFKSGKCIDDDFYVRGDGTRCFFFTEDYVRRLFCDYAGLEEEQLKSDRRLQVNRGKQVKMYRVWIQAKYTKGHRCCFDCWPPFPPPPHCPPFGCRCCCCPLFLPKDCLALLAFCAGAEDDEEADVGPMAASSGLYSLRNGVSEKRRQKSPTL